MALIVDDLKVDEAIVDLRKYDVYPGYVTSWSISPLIRIHSVVLDVFSMSQGF